MTTQEQSSQVKGQALLICQKQALWIIGGKLQRLEERQAAKCSRLCDQLLAVCPDAQMPQAADGRRESIGEPKGQPAQVQLQALQPGYAAGNQAGSQSGSQVALQVAAQGGIAAQVELQLPNVAGRMLHQPLAKRQRAKEERWVACVQRDADHAQEVRGVDHPRPAAAHERDGLVPAAWHFQGAASWVLAPQRAAAPA